MLIQRIMYGCIIDGLYVQVLPAKHFQEALTGSPVVICNDIKLKNKIMQYEREEILVVTAKFETIIEIIRVERYDEEYLKKIFEDTK